MTLESIEQMALRQGKEEIDKMRKATGKMVLAMQHAAAEEADFTRAVARAWAENEAKRLGESKISAAKLGARKLILVSKAEVLEKVREGAMARLTALPIVERERIIKKLLAKARKHIPEGTVHVREEDRDILKANLGSYRMGPPAMISGGIIVESQDRKRRLDLSFEMLFEGTWERCFSDISQILFREGYD